MTEGRYTYKDDEPKKIFREVEQVTMEKTHGDEFHRSFIPQLFMLFWSVPNYIMSESEVEASKEGRRLANFRGSFAAMFSCRYDEVRVLVIYAGRGLSEGYVNKGETANDVEIEQIVSQEGNLDMPYKITLVVQ
ncbi:hypothetical protein KSS87_011445 [Heliosperma pusillum]|nr:hypothetical protein KSS87_011445 [Heliosperma pusillum]